LKRAQWAVVLAAGAAVLLVRIGALAVAYLFSAPVDTRALLSAACVTVVFLLPLPFVIDGIQRSSAWSVPRQLVAMAAIAAGYVLVTSSSSAAVVVHFFMPWKISRAQYFDVVLSGLPAPIINFAMAFGIAQSLRWCEAAAAVETRRRNLESEAIQKARTVLKIRYRPAIVIGTLRRMMRELESGSRAKAEALLRDLSRYARFLLGSPSRHTSFDASLRAMRIALSLQEVDTAIVVDGESGWQPQNGDLLTSAIELAATETRPAVIRIALCAHEVRLAAEGEPAHRFAQAFARQAAACFRVSEISPCEVRVTEPVKAAAGHAEAELAEAPPLRPVLFLIGMIGAHGVAATLLDLREAEMSVRLPLARVASFILWLLFVPVAAAVSKAVTHVSLRGVIAAVVSTAILSGLAVTAASLLMLDLAGIPPDSPASRLTDPVIILTRNVALALVIAGIVFAEALARIVIQRRNAAARLRDSEALAETRELENALHPHFLFNALTMVAALINTCPAKAALVCGRLANFVHKTVSSAGVEQWPLHQEIDLTSEYLAIQQLRFGERVQVAAWEVSPAAGRALVPRLLLQPLVENAFKHGVAGNSGCTSIGLSAVRRGRSLRILLWNDLMGGIECKPAGGGLAFVRQRLRDAGGSLSITGEPMRFTVRCSVPQ
jgi:two-component system sensor histidine kinase AlgZ